MAGVALADFDHQSQRLLEEVFLGGSTLDAIGLENKKQMRLALRSMNKIQSYRLEAKSWK